MGRFLDNVLALAFIALVFWAGMHAHTWFTQAHSIINCVK